jgi:hypothetical protein
MIAFHTVDVTVRSGLSQGADRDRAQARAEGESLGAGVEDDAGDEVGAGAFGQVSWRAKA